MELKTYLLAEDDGNAISEMNNAETAKALGVSKQFIFKKLRVIGPKIYKAVAKIYPNQTPFENFLDLAKILKIEADDLKDFLNIMPPNVKNEVEKVAKEKGLLK